MKRVVVTGASGFVGSNLIRRLIQDGHEAHVFLRREYQSWRLEEVADAVRIHEVDLEDCKTVGSCIAAVKPHWVFHFAAYGAYPNQVGIQRMAATNLLGSAALLDASAKAGVEAFIQAGSSSEYGYKDHPAAEEEILEPNSHYAITKAAATHYCQFTARTLDFNAVAVRLYSIYGPYEDPTRLIPTLILHGLRGLVPPLVSPRTARDFVYVDDAVEAMLQIAAKPSIPRGAVYNICSGVQSTLGDVVEVATRLMHIPVKPAWSTMSARSWDTDRWVGSPARTEREIGWCAKVGLETGMLRTINWFETHPDLRNFYCARVFLERSAVR